MGGDHQGRSFFERGDDFSGLPFGQQDFGLDDFGELPPLDRPARTIVPRLGGEKGRFIEPLFCRFDPPLFQVPQSQIVFL